MTPRLVRPWIGKRKIPQMHEPARSFEACFDALWERSLLSLDRDEPVDRLRQPCKDHGVQPILDELDALREDDLIDDGGDERDDYWNYGRTLGAILAEVGEPALPGLIAALDQGNEFLLVIALEALGVIGSDQAFEPLRRYVSREPDSIYTGQALLALGRTGGKSAVPILLDYLRAEGLKHESWTLRLACFALGSLAEESTIDALSNVLSTHPDWFARLGAAEGLAEFQHPRARAALAIGLNDDDPNVRQVSALALNVLPPA